MCRLGRLTDWRSGDSSKQADHATTTDLSNQNSRLEESILQAIVSSSKLVEDEVRGLSRQVENMTLNSAQMASMTFLKDHQQFMVHLSSQIDTICAMHRTVQTQKDTASTDIMNERIFQSLYFPQMQDRRNGIPLAYHDTYRWILSGKTSADARWDSLLAWLDEIRPSSNVYWIKSKFSRN